MVMVISNDFTIIRIRFRNKVVTERATHLIARNHDVVIVYNSLKAIGYNYIILMTYQQEFQ